MSLLRYAGRFASALTALLAICAAISSCGPASTGSGGWQGDKEMDAAVGAFISGDYADATARLEALAGKAQTPEQMQEVYWYLGRAYAATGDYSKAVDAFTAGKAHGGGIEFDEYVQRLAALLAGDPENVARAERVTRAQLAVLIDRMFYAEGAAAEEPPQGGSEGGVEHLAAVQRGVVAVLPDGRFHPDAQVTRASFFAAVSRLLLDRNIEADTNELFDGGFAWALAADAEQGRFVTGREVVATLQRVSAAQNSDAGQGS